MSVQIVNCLGYSVEPLHICNSQLEDYLLNIILKLTGIYGDTVIPDESVAYH